MAVRSVEHLHGLGLSRLASGAPFGVNHALQVPLIEALRRDGVVLLPNVSPLDCKQVSSFNLEDYLEWISEMYLVLTPEEKTSLGLVSPGREDVVTGFPNGRKIIHFKAHHVFDGVAADERNAIAYCSLRAIAENILKVLTRELSATDEPSQGASMIKDYIEATKNHSASTPVRPFEKGSQMSIFDYAECRPPATPSHDTADSHGDTLREAILCDDHIDRGLLTVVTNDVAGLQVCLGERWITVPRTDGIVAFLGLAGAKLLGNSLGDFPAVRHRVVHPACAGAPELPSKQKHAAERLKTIATQMNSAAIPSFYRQQIAAGTLGPLSGKSKELKVGIAAKYLKDVRIVHPLLKIWAHSETEHALAEKLGEKVPRNLLVSEWRLLEDWLQREIRGRCGARASISFKLRPPPQAEVGGAAEEALVRMMEELEAQLPSVNRPPPRHVAPIGAAPASLHTADTQTCQHVNSSPNPSVNAPSPSKSLLHYAMDVGFLDFLDVEGFVHMGSISKRLRTTAEAIFNQHPRSKLLMAKANIPWQRQQNSRSKGVRMSWLRFAGLWTCRLQSWARVTTTLSRGRIVGGLGASREQALIQVNEGGPQSKVSLALPWNDICWRAAQIHFGRNVDRADARWRLDMNGVVIAIRTRTTTNWAEITGVAERLIQDHGTDVFLGEVLEEANGKAEVEEIIHYQDPMRLKGD